MKRYRNALLLGFLNLLVFLAPPCTAGDIEYFDAVPGTNIEFLDGGVWNSGTGAFFFGTATIEDSLWDFTSNTDTVDGNVLEGGLGELVPDLRLTFSELDANVEYTFFVFNVFDPISVATIEAGVSTDISSTAVTPLLRSFSDTLAGSSRVIVDLDGNVLPSASQSNRRRYTLGTFTGSTEYGVYVRAIFGDSFSTFDGVGIQALTPFPSGDFDLDGDVDGNDYLVWQRDEGSALELAAWRENFGQAAPLNSAGVNFSGAIVPEPTTLSLIVASLFLFAGYRQTPQIGFDGSETVGYRSSDV